jgi:hypothetical protein
MCVFYIVLCSGTATNIRPYGTGQKWAQPAWGTGLGCSQFHVMSPPPAPAPATPVRGEFQARTCQHTVVKSLTGLSTIFLPKSADLNNPVLGNPKMNRGNLQNKEKARLRTTE